MTNKKRSPFYVHIYLFATFPILFLYSKNIDEVFTNPPIALLLVSLLMAVCVFRISIFILKEKSRAALFTTIFIIVFYSYGHIYGHIFDWLLYTLVYTNFKSKQAFVSNATAKLEIYVHVAMLGLLTVFLLLMLFYLRKKRAVISANTSKILNFIAIILCVFPIVDISKYLIKAESVVPLEQNMEQLSPMPAKNKNLPDIYYIILDGYARHDILSQYYGFDNSHFLDYLNEKDFFVAQQSYSNYSWTFLSLSSSLNMIYLNDIAKQLGSKSNDLRIPYKMIENNKVMGYLSSRGYTIVFFSSTCSPTRKNKYAHIEYSYDTGLFKDEFVRILAKTTLLRALDSVIDKNVAESYLYTFEKLKTIPDMEEPTFTFSHIVLPHHPYVFDSEGNIKNNPTLIDQFQHKMWEREGDYVEQTKFVNKKIMEIVDTLLKNSKTPPLIIIQSDHGPQLRGRSQEVFFKVRMANLNVMYLPGASNRLYNHITPVNTFRLIFSHYFGEEYPLLDDVSFYSNYRTPYKFVEFGPAHLRFSN